MSIGDALPAASAPVASPARTDTITKDKLYHIVNRQLHVAPSPAADYRDPASPYRELTLALLEYSRLSVLLIGNIFILVRRIYIGGL
jgi:hypothetical protein